MPFADSTLIQHFGNKINFASQTEFKAIRRDKSGAFQIEFAGDSGEVNLIISSVSFYYLLLATQQQDPHKRSAHSRPSLEAIRHPCCIFSRLTDGQVQSLLRGIQVETWADFMWIMGDEQIIKQIFRNLSYPAAQSLLEDLNRKWRGVNPDKATREQLHAGIQAIQELATQLAKIVSSRDFATYIWSSHD